MRERVFTIILIGIVILGAISLSMQMQSFIPGSLAAMTAIAFYTLGRQNGSRKSTRNAIRAGYERGYTDGVAGAGSPASPSGPDRSFPPVSHRR